MPNGQIGPVRRKRLPDAIRDAVDAQKPGSLVEPLSTKNLVEFSVTEAHYYLLLRVDAIVPAVLDAEHEELGAEVFDEWLAEQVAEITVKLEVKQWVTVSI